MTPRSRRSTPVYEALKTQIAADDFNPDGKLPSETDLAGQFKVSRGVVRQALGLLREDRLIESFVGSGSYVVWRNAVPYADFKGLSGIEGIHRCYEFRLFLDGEAAGLAAMRRGRLELKHLRSTLKALDSMVVTGKMGTRLDVQFHESVALASQNPFFLAAVSSLQDRIKELVELPGALALGQNRRRLALVQQEHWAVFDAIEAGNASRARLMMRIHLANSRKRVFANTGSLERNAAFEGIFAARAMESSADLTSSARSDVTK